jgi:hypothetical protein
VAAPAARHKDTSGRVAKQIATALGETAPFPVKQITRIVQTVGEERALQFLEQARAIQERGGQMLPDGSRKHTPGGVFFRLVRESLPEQERLTIWPIVTWKERKAAKKAARARQEAESAPAGQTDAPAPGQHA